MPEAEQPQNYEVTEQKEEEKEILPAAVEED